MGQLLLKGGPSDGEEVVLIQAELPTWIMSLDEKSETFCYYRLSEIKDKIPIYNYVGKNE